MLSTEEIIDLFLREVTAVCNKNCQAIMVIGVANGETCPPTLINEKEKVSKSLGQPFENL